MIFFNTDVFLSSPPQPVRESCTCLLIIFFLGTDYAEYTDSSLFFPRNLRNLRLKESSRRVFGQSPLFSKTKSINEYSFTKEVVTVFLMLVLIELEALFM